MITSDKPTSKNSPSYNYKDKDITIARSADPDLFKGIRQLRRALRLEDGYHGSDHSYYGRVNLTFGADLPKLRPGARILDLGCSKGFTTIELATLYEDADVTGVEIRPYLRPWIGATLAGAKRDPRTLMEEIPPSKLPSVSVPEKVRFPKEFIVADGFGSALPTAHFDAVFAMNSIYFAVHVMPMEKLEERMSQLSRLVAENGYLLISGSRDYDQAGNFREDYIDYIIFKKIGNSLVNSSSRMSSTLISIGTIAALADAATKSA